MGSCTRARSDRGTRETRLSSLVSEDRSYKPTAKSGGGQRESEGVVVVPIGVQLKAPGAKGPDFGHGWAGVSVRAWSARSDPATPMGFCPSTCRVSGGGVRELQRKLWVAAKRSPDRRFHALFDRIHRSDVLREAWRRVRENKGAAGVDRQTLAAVEELRGGAASGRAAASFVRILSPAAVRRVTIPKPTGWRSRPLGIPTVKDRIAQQAARDRPRTHLRGRLPRRLVWVSGPRRSATDAKEVLRRSFIDGHHFVFEADIRDCFAAIDHERLLSMVAERVSDRRVLKLCASGSVQG